MSAPESFLDIKAVMSRVCLARSALYERIREGDFPEPIKLGERKSAWIESEVSAWIQRQISASRAARRKGGAA